MSDNEKSFIQELKKQALYILIAYAFTMIATLIGFYFRTESKLEYYDQRIQMQTVRQENVEHKIELVNEKKIEKSDYIREADEIKQLLKEVREDVKKLTK